MADPSIRAERLASLLTNRHPGWAHEVEPEGMRAGTISDPVGQIYGCADDEDYGRALHDLGIRTDPSVYGLAPRFPSDTAHDLDLALTEAVLDCREKIND